MDTREAHKLLNQEILETAKNYYAELAQNRAALDKKAEGTISVAGIFLAAMFAFARELGKDAGVAERALLAGVVAALVGVVVLCLMCLWTRRTRTAPPAAVIREQVNAVVAAQQSRPEEEFLYLAVSALNTLSSVWDESSRALVDILERKGRLVKAAQVVLLAAIVLVAVIVAAKIALAGYKLVPA